MQGAACCCCSIGPNSPPHTTKAACNHTRKRTHARTYSNKQFAQTCCVAHTHTVPTLLGYHPIAHPTIVAFNFSNPTLTLPLTLSTTNSLRHALTCTDMHTRTPCRDTHTRAAQRAASLRTYRVSTHNTEA